MNITDILLIETVKVFFGGRVELSLFTDLIIEKILF